MKYLINFFNTLNIKKDNAFLELHVHVKVPKGIFECKLLALFNSFSVQSLHEKSIMTEKRTCTLFIRDNFLTYIFDFDKTMSS